MERALHRQPLTEHTGRLPSAECPDILQDGMPTACVADLCGDTGITHSTSEQKPTSHRFAFQVLGRYTYRIRSRECRLAIPQV
jgi:hypothetical protein